MMKTDPITLEVMRNAFQSVAEEMGAALIRTALSPNIKDRRDCSTGIYSAQGELVAQAEHIPLHLGLMPSVVKSTLKIFPVESLNPGDAIITNDPYVSGSHLPDICIISPLFYEASAWASWPTWLITWTSAASHPGACPPSPPRSSRRGSGFHPSGS